MNIEGLPFPVSLYAVTSPVTKKKMRHIGLDRDVTFAEIGKVRGKGLLAGQSLCGRDHKHHEPHEAALVKDDCYVCHWLTNEIRQMARKTKPDPI